MDGLDIAYCRFEKNDHQWNYEILKATTIPFPEEIKAQLPAIPSLGSENFVLLDHQLG